MPTMAHDALTSGAALALAKQSPFENFQDLKVAVRKYFGEHFLEMPPHYKAEEFMEFLFDEKIVLRAGKAGWRVNPGIIVSVRLDQVAAAQAEEPTV